MRSIRQAVLKDVGALSDCDREFDFGSRKEFVERSIRRGGGYILEQEGTVIGVAVLEYTFSMRAPRFVRWCRFSPQIISKQLSVVCNCLRLKHLH